MALSNIQASFGIHSVCAYNPETRIPYGIMKVLGSLTLNNQGEQIPLNGGSLLYPWKVEKGAITTEGNFVTREIPNWSFTALQGSEPTVNSAEANGNVDTPINVKGSSVIAATGIASVSVKSGEEANVKTGIFVIKAVSATTVDVYSMSDSGFKRGSNLAYVDDTLKITSSPLTITTGSPVEIPNTGLEITGGAGTIAMTEGDTAMYAARSQNTRSTVVKVGASGETIPDVGLFCAAQEQGTGEMIFLDIFRAAVSGFPMSMTEKAWAEADISFQAYYDQTRDGVYEFRYTDGT